VRVGVVPADEVDGGDAAVSILLQPRRPST
jgi:hypothetical protein